MKGMLGTFTEPVFNLATTALSPDLLADWLHILAKENNQNMKEVSQDTVSLCSLKWHTHTHTHKHSYTYTYTRTHAHNPHTHTHRRSTHQGLFSCTHFLDNRRILPQIICFDLRSEKRRSLSKGIIGACVRMRVCVHVRVGEQRNTFSLLQGHDLAYGVEGVKTAWLPVRELLRWSH